MKTLRRVKLGLAPLEDGDNRINTAKVASAWEASGVRVKTRQRSDAEAAAGNLPKVLPKRDRLSLVTSFQETWYQQGDTVTPSETYVELRFDQLDTGDLKAENLKEMTSIEESSEQSDRLIIEKGGGDY